MLSISSIAFDKELLYFSELNISIAGFWTSISSNDILISEDFANSFDKTDDIKDLPAPLVPYTATNFFKLVL